MSDIERPESKALGALAQEINEEHHAFVGSLQKTAEHGIRAGELLVEAKAKCNHGTWLPWLENNFEGAPRTAQEYMRLYKHRDEVRAKTRSSAHLSISGALREIASPEPNVLTPEEEDIFLRHYALEYGDVEDLTLVVVEPTGDGVTVIERERLTGEEVVEHGRSVLAGMEPQRRRGYLNERAFRALVLQARRHAEAVEAARWGLYEHLNGKLAAMDVSSRVSKFDHYPRLARMLRTVEEHLDTHEPLEVSERAFLEEALPKLLEDVDRELAELEWWLGRVNWLESQVRAEDYPPGRGMPDAAFDESRKHMTLKELCEAGELSWPAECVREVYGAVV